MSLDLAANPNTDWAAVFMNELALGGLSAVCFAPGSRSTPLILAADANPDLTLYRHLDERSAGFFALGLAKATSRPVALICTSGSAVANFFPAVIEANESKVPLLLLTADRPPELRGSGANQTIDQVKFFGDHVRHYVEAPVPQPEAPAVVRRHLRTLAARVLAMSSGPPPGPVQVNFPFRKPLEPAGTAAEMPQGAATAETDPHEAYTQFQRGTLRPTAGQVASLTEVVAAHPAGLIICGPNCPPGDFAEHVAELSAATGYPVVADPLSGLRHGPHLETCTVLGGYDLLLSASPACWPRAELIIRFGDVPTSAALNSYIERSAPDYYFHIRSDGVWSDDLHLVRSYWQVDERAFCSEIAYGLRSSAYAPETMAWTSHFRDLEAVAWRTLDAFIAESPFYDGAAVSAVLGALANDAAVFAGNSLPVRHIDLYDRPSSKPLRIDGNRGASGIDGNVSTAAGIAAGLRRRVIGLMGDITFYHDLNGLLALQQPGATPVTFVVLNNDGGGIFRRLPIAAAEPPFTDLFLTPHGLTFEHAAKLYGIGYLRIANDSTEKGVAERLEDAVLALEASQQSAIIEVVTDGADDLRLHRALLGHVARVLADSINETTDNQFNNVSEATGLVSVAGKQRRR